jgi:signal transduction histidine kinase
MIQKQQGDAVDDCVHAIRSAGQRMERLIQDLLDITRADNGKLRLHATRVTTEELLAEVERTARPQARVADLDLKIEVRDGSAAVFADRERLLRVFDNLIGNAVKFTEPGGKISVSAAQSGGQVLFRVADTGCGIKESEQPHLFERFWQGSDLDRRGLGLGLTAAKALVEAQGGCIWVNSRPGGGSTFSFTIPLADALPNPHRVDEPAWPLRPASRTA